MGVFSRLSDIINSNINSMLDKAEDPEKIARLIIQEMEDCLVEVRSAAARSMADKKEYDRDIVTLEQTRLDWTAKAELAVEKGREDLARGALSAKQRAEREIDSRRQALKAIEDVSVRRQDDLEKLQAKLDEAKTKHRALVVRREAAEHRIAMRDGVPGEPGTPLRASRIRSAAYCTAFIMSKIGRYMATTMPPTTTPRNTIMSGSSIASSPDTAASTSSS